MATTIFITTEQENSVQEINKQFHKLNVALIAYVVDVFEKFVKKKLTKTLI